MAYARRPSSVTLKDFSGNTLKYLIDFDMTVGQLYDELMESLKTIVGPTDQLRMTFRGKELESYFNLHLKDLGVNSNSTIHVTLTNSNNNYYKKNFLNQLEYINKPIVTDFAATNAISAEGPSHQNICKYSGHILDD